VKRLGSVTAEMYFLAISDGRITCLADYAKHGPLSQIARRKNVQLPPLSERIAESEPLPAFLHTDRWLVACPDCRRDFQLVWTMTLLYMCATCWNADVGGRWRPVGLPPDRAAIEAAMSRRPRPQERNWLPGETGEHLLREEADPGRGTGITSIQQLHDLLGA